MSNSKGRKSTHTKEELLQALNKYILKHPHSKVTLSGLANESGISRNIWKFNEELREIIDKINNPPVISQNEIDVVLPNSEELVNKYYSNKPKLIRAVQDSFDIINKLYDYAKIGFNVAERERAYKNEIEKLKAVNKEKDKIIEELNIEIDKLYIDSASPLQRNKQKIKDNLIELTPDRIKSLSMDEKDIKSEYEGLF